MKIYSNVIETIGNTPLVKLNRLAEKCKANVLCKLEYFNPASSVKDRIGANMLTAAEKAGLLKPGGTVIEPTSGNTGIGLALTAAVKGYKLILTMPETMSMERIKLLEYMGAKVVLTDGEKGMKGAIETAKKLLAETPNAFMPQQFSNPANPEAHEKTTAVEIWNDTEGTVDILVAGVGTGGTISGAGRALKEKKPEIKLIAVEPSDSPVLSGGSPGKHGIQGIGAGFIPEILDVKLIDEIVTVTEKEALETAEDLARKEGILCGISSGANVSAALKIAGRKENAGKNIVVIVCDTAERYLSTKLFSYESMKRNEK